MYNCTYISLIYLPKLLICKTSFKFFPVCFQRSLAQQSKPTSRHFEVKKKNVNFEINFIKKKTWCWKYNFEWKENSQVSLQCVFSLSYKTLLRFKNGFPCSCFKVHRKCFQRYPACFLTNSLVSYLQLQNFSFSFKIEENTSGFLMLKSLKLST